MNHRRISWIVACAAMAIACGDDEPDTPAVVAPPMPELAERENHPPSIDRITLRPTRPLPGETVKVIVAASDADGDRITLNYDWRVAGKRVDAKGSSLNLRSLHKRDRIEVTVVASDGVDQSAASRASAIVGNQHPRVMQVVIEPLGSVTVGHDVTASPKSHDPDGDDIEYRYRWMVNGEEVGDEGPVLKRSHYKRGDKIEITVIATDGEDESAPMVSQPIEVTNARPKITSVPGAIDDDGVFRYRIRAEDPDGDRLFQYRLTEGPAGMGIDIVSGLLEWAPAKDQAGMHTVKLEVGDRNGGAANQEFQVDVGFESVPASQAN